jgi:hypothetical protein
MTASHPAATGETCTIYHEPQVFNQVAVYIVALLVPIFALIPIVAIRNDLKQLGVISTGTITLSLVLVLIILVAFWVARHLKATAYLIISPKGLEYYGHGITIKTPWSNVQEITHRSGLPSLLLHRPAATYLSPLHQRDLYTTRRIPLFLFQYSDQSALAHDLRRFAPQVFAKYS